MRLVLALLIAAGCGPADTREARVEACQAYVDAIDVCAPWIAEQFRSGDLCAVRADEASLDLWECRVEYACTQPYPSAHSDRACRELGIDE